MNMNIYHFKSSPRAPTILPATLCAASFDHTLSTVHLLSCARFVCCVLVGECMYIG